MKKGLVCPGYKQPLRWTNAIAVRGRFRGLAAPDVAQATISHEDQAADLDDSPVLAVTTTELPEADLIATLNRFTEPVIRRLLHYYETEITPIMPWIDSPHNGYRRLILPLAESQPILRLAILATAARHAAFGTGVDEDLLRSASETAVTMITLRLTQLTMQDPGTTAQYDVDPTDIQAIIAAVLVLSDYSLLLSNLYVAQFHREGIRTLLNTLVCTTNRDTEMFVFLQDEAAAYDVLACTSLFEIDRVRNAVLPSAQNNIFAQFLRVIHVITMSSLRPGVQSQSPDDDRGTEGEDDEEHETLEVCPASMTELENAFEAARGSTLLSAGPLLETASDTLRHDFICLVAAYHHAGLLYAYKRLPSIGMEASTRCYHLGRLFDSLEHIQEIRVVLSSLTWPLFIAGICCGDHVDRIQKVENWCQLLATDTRYEHYHLLTDFLRQLHHDPQHDWISLAKEYERQHHPIVAI